MATEINSPILDGIHAQEDASVNAQGEHARPRRRTRRACDKCNASRARCNGESPCRRCEEYGYTCRYIREVKKRGRLPASGTRDSSQKAQRSPLPAPPQPVKETGGEFPAPRSDAANNVSSLSHQDIHQDDGTQPSRAQDAKFPPLQQALPPRSATALSIIALSQSAIDEPPHPPVKIDRRAFRPRAGSSSVGGMDDHFVDSEVLIPDESGGYPSPARGPGQYEFGRSRCHRGSFRSSTSDDRNRESAGTTATGSDAILPNMFQKAATDNCCYKFLEPVLPYVCDIVPASVACELLGIFMTDPGSSLFCGASPYILTRIFRKKSVLHPTAPRYTTPALLATILWCVAQTADVMVLHVPGKRARVVNDLYNLATSLMSERDPDRWRRIHGGLRAENEIPHPNIPALGACPPTTTANEPAGVIDDVLTFILLSIAVSGSDFKSDCFKWWSKAIRLAHSLSLNREDERCPGPVSPCANPICSCRRDREDASIADIERKEERRRVFWLLYSLDRHLSLSFNTVLSIPDSYCEVYAPLPESIWENLDQMGPEELPYRVTGPPLVASGTGFFEYFLPLMAILGDIIEVHHRRRHPRLGGQEDTFSVAVIQDLLSNFELTLGILGSDASLNSQAFDRPGLPSRDVTASIPTPTIHHGTTPSPSIGAGDQPRVRLVKAYSTHILHVLHVLLHGKWDAISMLDDGDNWIASQSFTECASHAISASQSVSTILLIDPELTFMSYLFGIYLLQGSFILLLFADRMPQIGPNESVEHACEDIIRAHEVCVVTLNTEFQKNFRKVLRSTLCSVQGSGTTNWDERRARRRALSLYRWTKGAKELAL